jgi:hypothetical protein
VEEEEEEAMGAVMADPSPMVILPTCISFLSRGFVIPMVNSLKWG